MIGILLIATRKYKTFLKPLLEQIDKFFLPKEELTVFLFSDEEFVYGEHDYDFTIKQFHVPPYGFPEATMMRYEMFNNVADELRNCSHLVYMDVDMAIVAPIGNEILADGLLCVRHPAFFVSDGWGSPNNSQKSTTWFPAEKRKHYYCGGVQAGRTDHYLQACKVLSNCIKTDIANEVIPEWHDETAWNYYTNFLMPETVTELNPSYCMVEQPELQKAWGIDNLPPKIIALSKDHKSIRE